jgi:menaquinone-dependent protoporphyrinogen IX oxidase
VRTLIAFCTRYGATASTSEEIAKVLRNEGFDVHVVNTKKEKVKDISDQKELRQKKTAIFVSSGSQAIIKFDGDTEALANDWQKYVVDKVEKYSLDPVALGLFGGVWDYNKMGFVYRKTMGPFRMKLEEVGIPEIEPGVYDTRNWDEIRTWVKELVEKVNY